MYPGNPPYLEYVRSPVEQKREAAKSGPARSYDTEGMSRRTMQSSLGEDATPLFEITGNPNLVYISTLEQPDGCNVSSRELSEEMTLIDQDAIEVTRCVGMQE